MGVTMKRVVLNPRAYLTPFQLLVLFHHVPMFIAYGAVDRPTGYRSCAPLHDLFHWFTVSFVLHVVMAALLLFSVSVTLCSSVYRVRRPESWVILLLFTLYVANLVWTIYGEGAFPADTSACANDSVAVQDAADTVSYFQHFDLIFTAVALSLATCTSYVCGVHTSTDLVEAEQRWQRRCTVLFRLCTCKSVQDDQEEDIFESLGRILGKFFVVRYKTAKYEGLQFNDLLFCLGLVSRAQEDERDEQQEAVEADPEAATRSRFPATIEKSRLCDLAFYGRLAVGIYGWPVYFWYTPLRWFKIFSCWSSQSTEEQVIDHDNVVHGNRASFLNYTGIDTESLVYLNCYNFVFSAPYSIVKDRQRRELIISVRGSLSFYDFVTDGLAHIARMDPYELPADVPDPNATSTHYGMLRTARSLFADLQEGSRKTIFWDFAMTHCRRRTPDGDDWKIVVCGHSMGAGVGAVLALLLRKVFPATRAYLYAPPMLFDPATAEWTKAFMTTAVYGDDIVPRLSIANVTRLRDEMIQHFNAVAAEKLYKVRYGRRRRPAAQGDSSGSGNADDDSLRVAELGVTTPTAHDSQHRTTHDSSDGPNAGSASSETQTPSQLSQGGSHTGLLGMDFLRSTSMAEMEEIDVPGEIVHIETVRHPRVCSCTMLLGKQELTYTLRDASYFRRIWINARAAQDHMVHHYDRDIRHLITECLAFDLPDEQQIVQVDPEVEALHTELAAKAAGTATAGSGKLVLGAIEETPATTEEEEDDSSDSAKAPYHAMKDDSVV
ncbi:hypothetical protein ATCC90586_003404 [Pythium insidiosum]|nr:hypothetical protein ATCC90586_003404 [Pythium insidiosum]